MFESPKSIKLRSLVVATALSTTLLIAPAYADEEKSTAENGEVSDPLEALNRWTTGLNDMVKLFVPPARRQSLQRHHPRRSPRRHLERRQ
jgi:ABC-type transporter lipoprotein component MlaA